MVDWDRELQRWVVEHRIGLLDPLAESLSYAGRWSLLWLAIAFGIAVSRRRAAVLVAVAAAAALSSVVTNVLKDAAGRDRPDGPTLIPQPDTFAFPSGHASSSFACATVLAAFAPRWRWPLYVLAALVAWSRVYVGAHWPLDVLAGALLGLGTGLAVVAVARRLRLDPPI